MEEIELKLSVDETNLVLEALGKMQYARVYLLINKIHQQANAQLNEGKQLPGADEPESQE